MYIGHDAYFVMSKLRDELCLCSFLGFEVRREGWLLGYNHCIYRACALACLQVGTDYR